jgi:hypothetical protein
MEKFKSVTFAAAVVGMLTFSTGASVAHTPVISVASPVVITVSGSAGINL